MIRAIFSTIKTIPYTDSELESMSFSDRKIITDFNYEKAIGEEEIDALDYSDISEVRRKAVDLCKMNGPKPIILVMPNYSLNSSYMMGKEYKPNDLDAIFESLIFKNENGQAIEIVRIMGNHLDYVLRCASEYAKLHKLIGQLEWKTNLIHEGQKMVYHN